MRLHSSGGGGAGAMGGGGAIVTKELDVKLGGGGSGGADGTGEQLGTADPTSPSGTGGGNYRELYQDLVQQFECEKKLNNSMVDALENKVSELIAENDTLKLSNIKLKK